MKKITFFKTLRDGGTERADGYLYEAQNGVKVAIYKSGYAWCATELTTGLDCGIGTSTREYAAAKIEQRANSIAHILQVMDCSEYIKRVAEAMAI